MPELAACDATTIGPAMPRLLLISYFFPPHGGAGVQRALKFCTAATSQDWQVTVLAHAPHSGDLQDPTMLAEIPTDVSVVRTSSLPLHELGPWVRKAVAPDAYLGWYPQALRAARLAVRAQPCDAIVSTSMPYTAHLVAQTLKRDLGLPWLADLRDPWTDNRFMAHYHGHGLMDRWRQWIDARLEQAVYAQADAITVTAEPLRRLLMDKHGIQPERVHLVRNGYDEADFRGILPQPVARAAVDPSERAGHDLRILFAGSIYEGYTIEPFFAAWQRLLQRRPDLRIQLTVHTQNTPLLHSLLQQYPLPAARTQEGGRIAHKAVVQRYGEADLLVLSCLDDLSIPGKLFEYIRCGTPVLAFTVADAEANTLLRQTASGFAVQHDDVEAGARQLERLYDAWLTGQPLTHPDAQAVAKLERRVAFGGMFCVLDRLVASRAPA